MHDWIAAWWLMPTHTNKENLAIFLRWVHLTAGIMWIGLLYFFNLVNVPFMRHVDPAFRPTVLQRLLLPALNLFLWSGTITVFFGFWYWAEVYVAADARLAGVSPWSTIGLFLLIWLVAWGIFFGFLKSTPNPWALGILVIVVLSLAGWLFVRFTPVGGEDNHVLCIGVGGGLGIFMLMTAIHVVVMNYKKLIRGELAGTPLPNAAKLQRQIFLAARVNALLSLPMIFFMAASSHYTILGG